MRRFAYLRLVTLESRIAPSAGQLDKTFGEGGIVVTNVSPYAEAPFTRTDWAEAVAVQADGKIVAAGTAIVGAQQDFALARYDKSGRLDPTFGTNGIVTTDFTGGPDGINRLAVLPNGRILVQGYADVDRSVTVTDKPTAAAVASYLPDGTLVWKRTIPLWDPNYENFQQRLGEPNLAVRNDGSFYLAGRDNSAAENGDPVRGMGYAHFGPDGAFLGAHFIAQGYTLGTAVTVEPATGRVLVAGGRTHPEISGLYNILVARFNTDGTPDTGFGTGGVAEYVTLGGDEVTDVAVQQDGRVVVGGYHIVGQYPSATEQFQLARFLPDGRPDLAFGGQGKGFTQATSGVANALQIQDDGKLLLAGWSDRFKVARYTADGKLDPEFGTDGVVETPTGAGRSFIDGAALDRRTGTLVVAGSSPDPDFNFTLARYRLDCELDVKYFSQAGGDWGNGGDFPLLESPVDTIKSDGCALSVLAMMLQYAGVETNPAHLNNTLLLAARNFEIVGYINGSKLLFPDAVYAASVVYGRPDLRFDDRLRGSHDAVKLEDLLCGEGLPVMVGVKYDPGKAQPGHYILVTGMVRDEGRDRFTVLDPGDEAKQYLDEYEDLAAPHLFEIRGVVRSDRSESVGSAEAATASAGGELVLSSQGWSDDIRLLVIDPDGRRAGADPSTGEVLREIPGVVVGDDLFENDPGGTAFSPLVSWIHIRDPIPGDYRFTLSSLSDQRTQVVINGVSASGEVRRSRVTDQSVPTGVASFYEFTVGPDTTFNAPIPLAPPPAPLPPVPPTLPPTVPPTIPPTIPPTTPPTVLPVGAAQFAAGADRGGTPDVRYFNPDGSPRYAAIVFPAGFTGGVRTAAADFNRDGVADLVVGTGPGIATRVRVLDGQDRRELFTTDPFESSFTGGVYVAAGDLNGDGGADLVISPDEGGGPRVRVFNGNGFTPLADFFGIDDPNFRGGARAAVGDVNGDGAGDLIVAAGFQGGPRVAGFSGPSLGSSPVKVFGDFFAFEETLRNGVFVAAGDLDGDGFADVIAGGGPGGGPRVTAFSGKSLLSNAYDVRANFFGGDEANRGGIRLAVKDLDGDTRADLVVGSGNGAGSRVTGYAGKSIAAGTPPPAFDFDAFPGFAGGVFVG